MIMKTLNPWRRAARLTTTFAIVVSASACVAHAQGQTPSAMFQNSTLTGSGNTITATRVPLAITSTLIVYVDMTLQFKLDSSGNLTLAAGYPQIAPSANLLTGGFKAGTYVGPSTLFNGKGLITISGPGVTDGGATVWSLSVPSGADGYTTPNTATWYAGPISSSPYASRLKTAGITSTVWSYGVASGPSWRFTNQLIGVAQIGNTITIANFSDSSDYSTPTGQTTFTLVQ